MNKAKKRKLPPVGAGIALAFLLAALPGILLAGTGDIYRKRMADPLWWVGINSTDYPLMFGAHWQGGSNNKDRLVLHYRNGSDQQKTLEPGVSGDDYVCNENWYRWRVHGHPRRHLHHRSVADPLLPFGGEFVYNVPVPGSKRGALCRVRG